MKQAEFTGVENPALVPVPADRRCFGAGRSGAHHPRARCLAGYSLACVSGDVPGEWAQPCTSVLGLHLRTRWVILLASGLLVMGLAFLLSSTAEGERKARGLAASGVGGVAAGTVVALRRARARPHHVSRRSEGRSLR